MTKDVKITFTVEPCWVGAGTSSALLACLFDRGETQTRVIVLRDWAIATWMTLPAAVLLIDRCFDSYKGMLHLFADLETSRRNI